MNKLIPLALLTIALTGCSKHSELHDSMEDMGGAYKAMRDSDDLAQIKKEWDTFKASLDVAEAQMVKPEDQATFNEGIDELTAAVARVDAAIASGNMMKTKELLKGFGDIRKEYHDKLGVKKD